MTTSVATSQAHRPPQRVTHWVLLACVVLIAGGCTSIGAPPPSPAVTPLAPAGEGEWWGVRVRMHTDAESAVAWHLDPLLAVEVFAPILDRFAGAIALWRFHRRAAPDDNGHQFTFWFYADPAIATKVSETLASSQLLHLLQRSQRVRELLLPYDGRRYGHDLAATSDRSWPMSMQRTWPWFIMGVSQQWLALHRELQSSTVPRPNHATVDELEAHYLALHQEVDALWQNNAQHAYLHHLNALFGYRHFQLIERRLTRF